MKNNKLQGVLANSPNQHGFPEDPAASRTALKADRETSTSPVPATGAAFHPEIIARAKECKTPVNITTLGVALESVPTYCGGAEKDSLPLGHYCNMNRCHVMTVEDLDWRDYLIPAMEQGVHHGIWGSSFSCITEHKGGDGVVCTITRDEKLFALLGVATTEESSSLVWEWLRSQYEVLRRVSLEVGFGSETGDLQLRRQGIIGDTYIDCAAPAKPARCPWFSYIVNDDRFHEHLLYYPEDTQMLAPLAYQWWIERKAAHASEEQANRLEAAA
jgi:hypothetical protein